MRLLISHFICDPHNNVWSSRKQKFIIQYALVMPRVQINTISKFIILIGNMRENCSDCIAGLSLICLITR
jgi:hypothetical protein